MPLPPPRSTLFPYTTLFRSLENADTLARTLSTGGKIVGLRNLRRCIRGCSDVRLQSARSVFFEPEMRRGLRSEEHTSELQSRGHLVCRLLLEKKKYTAHLGR